MALKRLLLIVGLYAVCALRCEAQFVGFVGLQTNQTQVLNASVATGRTAVNANIGGASHVFTYCLSGVITTLQFIIEESPDNVAGHWTQVGQTFGTPIQVNGNKCGVITFGGYYSNLAVNVLALAGGGNLSVWYSSIAGSTPSFPPAFNSQGAFSPVQCDKTGILTSVAASTTAQVLTGNGNQSIYICGFTISFVAVPTGAGAVTLEYGTGASCTGVQQLWTSQVAASGTPQIISPALGNSVLIAPAAGGGNNVCLVTGAIVTATTVQISYAQF